MNTNLYILLLCSFCLFANCSTLNEKKGIGDVISVDVLSIKETHVTDREFQRIALSNNAQGMLGGVKKIYLCDSTIYIHHQQKMSMFDYDGSFKGNISSQGRADNEYLTLWYSFINGADISIYDMNGGKIMQYNTSDNSIKSIKLPERSRPFQALIPIGDNGYIGKLGFMGNADVSRELGFYNERFEFVQELGWLTLNSGLWLGYPFSVFNNEILYWRQLDNEIYSIDSNLNFTTKYTLDFIDKNIPEIDFHDDYEKIDFMNKTPKKYVAGLFDIEETNNFVCFVFIYNKTKNIAVYSKNNNNVNVYRFSFDNGEVLNTIVPHEEKIIVVTDSEDSSAIYIIDIDDL